MISGTRWPPVVRLYMAALIFHYVLLLVSLLLDHVEEQRGSLARVHTHTHTYTRTHTHTTGGPEWYAAWEIGRAHV